MNDPKRHLHPRFYSFSPAASTSSSSSSASPPPLQNPNPSNHNPSPPLPPLSSPSPPQGHLPSDHYLSLLKLHAVQQQQQQQRRALALRSFPPLSPQESSTLSFSDSSLSHRIMQNDSCVQSQGQTLGQVQREACVQPNLSIHGQNGPIHSQNGPIQGQNGSILGQNSLICGRNGPIRGQTLIYGQRQQQQHQNGSRLSSFFNSCASSLPIPMISSAKASPNIVVGSELPIIGGPTVLQGPVHNKLDHGRGDQITQRMDCGDKLPQRIEGREKLTRRVDADLDGGGSEESKRLKLTLEDLERELLGEETPIASTSIFSDMSTSCVSQHIQGIEPLAAAERDWTDVIEDLLAADITSHAGATAAATTTMLDQSTITSMSSNPSAEDLPSAESSSPTDNSTITTTSSMPQRVLALAAHPKELLLACANAINTEDYASADSILASLEQSVSMYGDPVQRLAAYMAEGLAARMELHRTGQSSRLSKITNATDILIGSQFLYHYCPYFKVGYKAANVAIFDALRCDTSIHIVDFNIGIGNQWLALITAFSQLPGGSRHVRITAVANPKASETLESVGRRLQDIANKVRLPFEFKALLVDAALFEPRMVDTRPGEALAINLAFHLHGMPDESVSTSNPRDSLLRKIKHMQPKIVTLVEYNANTNTSPFYPRFIETLNFFNAVFESLHATVQNLGKDQQKERVKAEQHCLARDIMNIIACEGADRLKRYEVAGKWKARMSMAGFRSVPLTNYVNKSANDILQHYPPQYRLTTESGALHLVWMERGLVSASAWS